ncbi:MAG TPA: NADH:flavin oxidoreductase/NADH oxidase [Verrucomicrobiae bacterium]|nr:NADH:flavin oxidoreductase/NADH oxidase [Verrucomicrobiae bacterium]
MSMLFSPLTLRDITFRNRVFVSPMCQYSSRDGIPTDWHMVHLGSRAVGGAGLVMVEASGVTREGMISPDDSGIWSDAHADAFRPIADFIQEQGSIAGIQLAHAGRKASTDAAWRGGGGLTPEQRGWTPVAPTDEPFSPDSPAPRALTAPELDEVVDAFRAAALRALAARFRVVEIHMAHGYLLHEFLSPLCNRREDEFGGSLENRMRFPLRVAEAVRDAWPDDLPLFVRISATDWVEEGWSLDDSVVLATRLKEIGVDLIDCSSGFVVPHVKIPFGAGFQVPLAAGVRRGAEIATGAVGYIVDPFQAEQIVATGQADAVLLAREMLRDPYWALHAARELGAEVRWPVQYERAVKRHP